ncbi:MAG TPA: glycosyltransferase family 2 protein [Candidatus Saccharibacteria bacterium]|nr:glycosyltransferase family 2 protein [Candidatus Saccharibacteria bacterium]HRQ97741.1 glycosyltransferase family 2 protein [Candidatus Saccharibacteria bacterium]
MTQTSTLKLAVVVLNWNGISDTALCLDALHKQTVPLTVIVVDNGSSDDSVQVLENRSDIILLKQPANLGFAGGVNVGIKYATENNFDAVALLNNDAVADKGWLTELVKTTETDEKIGIVTSLLLSEDGNLIDSTGEQYSKWGLPFPRSRGDKLANAPKSGLVFGATGGASLYKTALFKDIGLFDEGFFAYYEDVDISFRAQLAGWKVAYEPKAIAYHKQGATSKKIPGFTVYQTFKNLPLLFLKNVPHGLLFRTGVRFYFAYWLMLFNAIAKGSGIPAIKGLGKSFILGFKALSDRKDIQKNKRVTYKYIQSIMWDDLPPEQTGLRKLRKLFTGK